MILSFIICCIQVSSQSKGRKNLSKEEFYNPERKTQNYKLMYCWVNNDLNIVISILVFILVAANIYFSLIKSMIFVNKVKRNLEENEIAIDKKTINDIEKIKKTLYIYPLTSGIIWGIFCILHIVFKVQSSFDYVFSWIYCILVSLRQPIYACIFLGTQNSMKKYCLNTLMCKNSKKKEKISEKLGDKNEKSKAFLDDDEP